MPHPRPRAKLTLAPSQRDRERLTLFESAVSHLGDAVVLYTAEAAPRIVYVNPAFLANTGYTWNETIGQGVYFLLAPGSSATARAKIAAALKAWEPIEIEILTFRKDGSEFWSELNMTPIADADGNHTHWVSMQRDVTARKGRTERLTAAKIAEAESAAFAVEMHRRKRMHAQLVHIVAHDQLTGLQNRATFIAKLTEEIERISATHEASLAVLAINVDGFSAINDRLGSRAGDLLLREIGARLTRGTRAGDQLARVGSDEFVIALERPQPTDANEVGQLIRTSLAAPFTLGTHDVSITASIGIAHFSSTVLEGETILANANAALLRAKRDGGNRVVTFTKSIEMGAASRSGLHGALERGEFRVHYQPLVDVSGARVYGFEALVRWQHPEYGMVAPLEFIPLAEELGLIARIGAWVLERACTMAKSWESVTGDRLLMSVNVSSRELFAPNFLKHLRDILERTQLSPKLLQLEITESVILTDAEAVGDLFAEIRGLGVKIAFDDFGTGYSSLSYLERYQIDVLKIDRSFVARVNDASAKSEVLRMIVALAESLGTEVIAEGVELREQRDALIDIGCTSMQGYLFSRPIPEGDVAELLATNWRAKPEVREGANGSIRRFWVAGLRAEQLDELDSQIDTALGGHHLWVAQLNKAIETGQSFLNVETVAQEAACPIGEWLLETIDPKLRESPFYEMTKRRHAVFHRSAARLLSQALAGDERARVSIEDGGEFAMTAALLVGALREWQDVARRSAELPRLASLDDRDAERDGQKSADIADPDRLV